MPAHKRPFSLPADGGKCCVCDKPHSTWYFRNVPGDGSTCGSIIYLGRGAKYQDGKGVSKPHEDEQKKTDENGKEYVWVECSEAMLEEVPPLQPAPTLPAPPLQPTPPAVGANGQGAGGQGPPPPEAEMHPNIEPLRSNHEQAVSANGKRPMAPGVQDNTHPTAHGEPPMAAAPSGEASSSSGQLPAQRQRVDGDSPFRQQDVEAAQGEVDGCVHELIEAVVPGWRLKVTDLTNEERTAVLLQLNRIEKFVLMEGTNEPFDNLQRDMPFLRAFGERQPEARNATIAGLSNLVCSLLNRLSLVPCPEAPAAGSSSGDVPAQPDDAPSELDVLIVVCSPGGAPLPRAFDEAHAIAGCVRGAGRTVYILNRGGAAAINKLLQELAPRVVWFIGHGDVTDPTHNRRTFMLTAENGSVEWMRPETLARIFGGTSRRRELVVLNGCETAATDVDGQRSICEAISQDFGSPTIGWGTLAADVAAQVFAIGIAASLAPQLAQPLSRAVIGKAFEDGKCAIEAMSRRRTSAGDYTEAWALEDPVLATRGKLPDGRFAAGVPLLLAPLPPDKLSGVPPPPALYIERTEVLKAQRQTLIGGGANIGLAPAMTSATGSAAPGGAGKSTLAAALARDVRVQSCFDLVLWVTFGQQMTEDGALRVLAGHVKKVSAKDTADVEVSAMDTAKLRRHVSTNFSGLRVLLISDDVWQPNQKFQSLTAERGKLVHLVTTRNRSLLPGGEVQHVPPWEASEARPLFDQHLGRAPDASEVEATNKLLEMGGGLPVRIIALATLSRLRGVAGALGHMVERRELREEPDLDPVDGYEDEMLEDALEGTLRFLDQNPPRHVQQGVLRTRCLMISALPEDLRVPVSVVAQLWAVDPNLVEAERCVKALSDHHLINYHPKEVRNLGVEDRDTVSVIDPHRDCLAAMGRACLEQWRAQLLCRAPSYPSHEDYGFWGNERVVLSLLSGCGEGNLGECDLYSLDLSRMVDELPAQVCELRRLRELNLEYCVNLTSLPAQLCELTELQTLILTGCKALTELPDLSKLWRRKLAIRDLPSRLMPWLENGCRAWAWKRAHDDEWLLESEEWVQVAGSPDLLESSLEYNGDGRVIGLRLNHYHWAEEVEEVKELPPTLGDLDELQTLELEYCRDLTSLPKSLGQCALLQTLELEYCYSLTSLPESLGQCQGLQTVKVKECDALTSLPESLSGCCLLETLEVTGCRAIRSLPSALGQEPTSLRTLVVTGCDALTSLPRSLAHCDWAEFKVEVYKDCKVPESIEHFVDVVGDYY